MSDPPKAGDVPDGPGSERSGAIARVRQLIADGRAHARSLRREGRRPSAHIGANAAADVVDTFCVKLEHALDGSDYWYRELAPALADDESNR